MAKVQSYKRPKDMKKTLGQFVKYLGNYRYYLILVSILVIIAGVANLIGTFSIKWLVSIIGDTNLSTSDKQIRIVQLICMIGGIYALGAIANLSYTQVMVRLSQKIVYDMRNDLFKNVDKLPVKYFDNTEFGDIMSCFTNDVETVSDALNNAFANIIDNLVQLIGTIICIFLLSWQLSLICIFFYILMVAYLIFSSKKSKHYFKIQQEKLGELSGFSEESIRGIKVVKVFNHEEETFSRFSDLSSELTQISYKALFYSNSMVPMVMAISYFCYATVTIVGGLFALNGIMAIANLSPYIVFVRQTSLPINRFTAQSNILLNALASCERIFALINLKHEEDKGTIHITKKEDENHKLTYYFNIEGKEFPIKGDVRFNNVYFSYYPDKMILKDLSLYAKPGQKIAFVGSTGAGKTTITNLINRFYDINQGSITYDGIDIKDICKDDLRSTMGMVLQETHLFTGTIEENIKFGKLNATHEEVIAASKLANADSFIKRLPQGYDTMLTSDGANLSQGQRQLLAIARAAISDPKVLILDEATSSVDTYTEKLIQEGMDKLMENRTVFVIAHRLSTVRNANAIIVLEQGKIIERGDHDDLINQKGRYYQLYTGKSELE